MVFTEKERDFLMTNNAYSGSDNNTTISAAGKTRSWRRAVLIGALAVGVVATVAGGYSASLGKDVKAGPFQVKTWEDSTSSLGLKDSHGKQLVDPKTNKPIEGGLYINKVTPGVFTNQDPYGRAPAGYKQAVITLTNSTNTTFTLDFGVVRKAVAAKLAGAKDANAAKAAFADPAIVLLDGSSAEKVTVGAGENTIKFGFRLAKMDNANKSAINSLRGAHADVDWDIMTSLTPNAPAQHNDHHDG